MRRFFETEQWLPLPLERVFAFFANPVNLPPLMPGWQHARIEAASFQPPPPRPGGLPAIEGAAAGDGTELTITARPFPFSPLRGSWLARIEQFRWNEGFCDVQLKGPFRFWRHCHSVRAAEKPVQTGMVSSSEVEGTIVRDVVEYELPIIGNSAFIDRLAVRPQLGAMFAFRQRRAAQLLAAETLS